MGLVGLTAAAVLAALALGGSSSPSVRANSVVALDSTGSVESTVPTGARPVALAAGADALWAANLDDRSVTRVDPASGETRSLPVGGAPTALAWTRDGVWVADGRGRLSKLDALYDRVTSTRSLVQPTLGFPYGATTTWPAVAAFESIWVATPDGVVLKIDPETSRPTASVGVGNFPSAIAAGADSIWVTNRADGTVTRIDARTLTPQTIPVGHGPSALSVNDSGAWIANSGDNTVVRVDIATNAVAETADVGDGPSAVHATDDAVWVANGSDGTVMRLDPESGDVEKTIEVGGTPTAFASLDDRVWVSVAPAPPPRPEAGGAARLALEEEFPSLDPGLGLAPQLHFATCANLVTYPDAPAPEGSRIVPEVAAAVPTPTAGGTTYTFTIRPGFRFSPPSGERVTAETFKQTIERIADPRMTSVYTAPAFSAIEGFEDYASGKASELSGLVARGDTLTVRLSRPDGGFLSVLADGAACAVPRGTPVDPDGIDTIPSAGPYFIASYTPRREIVLRRNPNYGGTRAQNLDEIVIPIGIESAKAQRQIEAGELDWAFSGPPRDAGPRLEREYGATSSAGKAGAQQYFVSEANGGRFLHMNTSRPLVSDVRLRRAVKYAIDRQALAGAGRRVAEINPFNSGTPTDDYLPPATTGGRQNAPLYPARPDLARAKRLAGRRPPATAVMYTPSLSPWREEARIVQQNLAPLGIEVVVKEFAMGDYFARIGRPGEPFDLAITGWWFGTTDPARILDVFDGSTIGSFNLSHFDDPAVNARLRSLAKFSGARRYREYSRLALELARDYAPAAAFATTESRDFFSARMGCQVYHPVFGIDIAALCLAE